MSTAGQHTTVPADCSAAQSAPPAAQVAHEAKVLTSKQCQTIYLNLLEMMDADLPSTIFLHELEQTRRCDKVAHDLSQLRANYTSYREQVAQLNRNQDAEWVAACTVAHYGKWTKTKLADALDWPSWAYYKIVYRWESTVGVLALGGGFDGAKLIERSVRLGGARGTPKAGGPQSTAGKEASELS